MSVMNSAGHGLVTDVTLIDTGLSGNELNNLQWDVDLLFNPKDDPLDISKELRLKAEEELNETPERLSQNIQELKRLIENDDKLNARTDDVFLAAFLRGRKHDVAKAFQCLQNFYEFKARYPDFYSYALPSDKPELYDQNHFASLPGVDRKGRKLCACVPSRIDLDLAPVCDSFKMGTAILELMLNDLELQITGTVVIFDLADFSIIQQARIVTPTSAWHMAMIAQDKIPLRVKAVHVINQPFYFNALYAVFRPFLKKKLRKRIHLHGSDMSSLHKHIAPEHLPVQWGGTRLAFDAKVTKLYSNSMSTNSKLVANLILLMGANVLGLTSYYLEDKQQRTAFLETKQCLEMKLVIEEQSAEQERLLLSVLPEHVAVKMRQDLGSALDTQFKKIYMSRHENVSILYADIVGFTAISSTYSASELVKILNELFARFDRLSEKYEQLRIKILGDCYYCISGAPRERPDHAVLSVHMGLSMVKAIKYVQQTTNSPVDMRVGIHTGAVLAGVLGQRQWQFDVYSKDVELANKMESSGLPGRVHISEKTLSFLNGEFEVEPGLGEKREETLRMAGIKTYFIVKTLKPFKNPNGEVRNGNLNDENFDDNKEEDLTGIITPVEDSTASKSKDESDDFRQRLRKDLMNRDGHRDLSKHTTIFTLAFRDTQKEKNYIQSAESFNSVSLVGCPLALLFTSAAQTIVLPRDTISFMSFGVGFWFLVILTLLTVAEAFPNLFPEPIITVSKAMNYSVWGRRLLAAIFILVLGTANLVDTKGDPQSGRISAQSAPVRLQYSLSLLLILVTVALAYLARHMEKASRVLFLWKTEAEEQRERASDIRRRNEALVYNILPQHVAAHFLGNKKRQHEELYSQSYAEVGVLFASMPNFSDFYSEETVNNQGLECLRFLNEVISDFDALLEQPRFQDIIKIKTIGSTYMAASGLNPSRIAKADDPIEVRWAHLALLVEFAFELKKALQSINEQSFNHFVLKMGINHGPITAGVIEQGNPITTYGGNSVNVASRMESTGKAGCIQVTAETCEILQHFGYVFEQRGLVAVKGKGQLMTYYLIGKDPTGGCAAGQYGMAGAGAMETLREEEEEEQQNDNSQEDIAAEECGSTRQLHETAAPSPTIVSRHHPETFRP